MNEQISAAKEIKAYFKKYNLDSDEDGAINDSARVEYRIYTKCNEEWHPDLKMVIFCTKEQEASAIRLGRIGGSKADSIEFEEGVLGDVSATLVTGEFRDRHGFGGPQENIATAAAEGNKAATTYQECSDKSGGPKDEDDLSYLRPIARCIIAAEENGFN